MNHEEYKGMHTYDVDAGEHHFSVFVHPCLSTDILIVNIPGFRGDIDGFGHKYRRIGTHLAEKGVAAFIQMPNVERSTDERAYCLGVINDIESVCRHARKVASQFCGSAAPRLCLAGFSAGGAAAAAAAQLVDASAILLVEPAPGLAHWASVKKSLSAFTGDLYVVTGSNETAIGEEGGRRFYELARPESRKGFHAIPNCDHQFRGRTNGQIMAKAYEWAFAGERTFPSPDGGLVLY